MLHTLFESAVMAPMDSVSFGKRKVHASSLCIWWCRTVRGGTAASKAKSSTYSYDAVYEPGSSQQAVFADVEPVVTSVMDGYNVCIFAYGQTGIDKSAAIHLVCQYAEGKHIVPCCNPGLASKWCICLSAIPMLTAHQTCIAEEEKQLFLHSFNA